jgi:hypothetical protein
MKGKQLLLAALACLAAVSLVVAVQAIASEVADVIKMDEPSYENTKGIVELTHTKHVEEYGSECGDCHHDDKGQPLADQAAIDAFGKVKCIECHTKPGEVPKDVKKEWRDKGIKGDEKKKLELEYHAEAVHMNCIDCHKAYNKENKTKAAPTTCTKCHPKTE